MRCLRWIRRFSRGFPAILAPTTGDRPRAARRGGASLGPRGPSRTRPRKKTLGVRFFGAGGARAPRDGSVGPRPAHHGPEDPPTPSKAQIIKSIIVDLCIIFGDRAVETG